MQKIDYKNLSNKDVKRFLSYCSKNVLYSFLIGSTFLALVKNYKKAMINEQEFSMFKYIREIEEMDNSENFKH